MHLKKILLIALLISSMAVGEGNHGPDSVVGTQRRFADQDESAENVDHGIVFRCSVHRLEEIRRKMFDLLKEHGINKKQVRVRLNKSQGTLQYLLNTDSSDTNTLDLQDREEYDLGFKRISWTDSLGNSKSGLIARQKEILLALMQNGRTHEFEDENCSFDSLVDHIEVRQNICYWGERAHWKFPEDNAVFNDRIWGEERIVRKGYSSAEAVQDTFTGKKRYEIGCKTACKLIMLQGMFEHVSDDSYRNKLLEKVAARDPLAKVGEEEDDYGQRIPGRFLIAHHHVPNDNWVPGDWGYIHNDDARSHAITGQEGTNMVYCGGGKFVSYYDGAKDVSLEFNLYKVYHWRKNALPKSDELIEVLRDNSNKSRGLVRIDPQRDVPRLIPLRKEPSYENEQGLVHREELKRERELMARQLREIREAIAARDASTTGETAEESNIARHPLVSYGNTQRVSASPAVAQTIPVRPVEQLITFRQPTVKYTQYHLMAPTVQSQVVYPQYQLLTPAVQPQVYYPQYQYQQPQYQYVQPAYQPQYRTPQMAYPAVGIWGSALPAERPVW